MNICTLRVPFMIHTLCKFNRTVLSLKFQELCVTFLSLIPSASPMFGICRMYGNDGGMTYHKLIERLKDQRKNFNWSPVRLVAPEFPDKIFQLNHFALKSLRNWEDSPANSICAYFYLSSQSIWISPYCHCISWTRRKRYAGTILSTHLRIIRAEVMFRINCLVGCLSKARYAWSLSRVLQCSVLQLSPITLLQVF